MRAEYRTCLLFLPVSSSIKGVRVSLSLAARMEVLKALEETTLYKVNRDAKKIVSLSIFRHKIFDAYLLLKKGW